MSEMMERLRLMQPLPDGLLKRAQQLRAEDRAAADAAKKHRAALHYGGMAIEALSAELKQWRDPEPPINGALRYDVEVIQVDGADWTCACAFDPEDNGGEIVHYVRIGQSWVNAVDVLADHLLARLDQLAADRCNANSRNNAQARRDLSRHGHHD